MGKTRTFFELEGFLEISLVPRNLLGRLVENVRGGPSNPIPSRLQVTQHGGV